MDPTPAQSRLPLPIPPHVLKHPYRRRNPDGSLKRLPNQPKPAATHQPRTKTDPAATTLAKALREQVICLAHRHMAARGHNQKQVAVKMGVKEEYLSRILNNLENMTILTASRVLVAAGVGDVEIVVK